MLRPRVALVERDVRDTEATSAEAVKQGEVHGEAATTNRLTESNIEGEKAQDVSSRVQFSAKSSSVLTTITFSRRSASTTTKLSLGRPSLNTVPPPPHAGPGFASGAIRSGAARVLSMDPFEPRSTNIRDEFLTIAPPVSVNSTSCDWLPALTARMTRRPSRLRCAATLTFGHAVPLPLLPSTDTSSVCSAHVCEIMA